MIKRLVAWLLLAAFSCTALAGTIHVQGPVYNAAAGGGGSGPTLVSYTETAWDTTGSSKNSASISWLAGDVVVILALAEDIDTLGVGTATGLTFTSQASNMATPSRCSTQLTATVAGGSGSSVVNVTSASSSLKWGFGVWVFRNSTGIGNSAEQHTTTATVPLTPTAAHGAIVYAVADFSADPLKTITPTPTNTRQRVVVVGNYTIYVADLTDQTSAGATSYGLTVAPTGPVSIIALEIKHP